MQRKLYECELNVDCEGEGSTCHNNVCHCGVIYFHPYPNCREFASIQDYPLTIPLSIVIIALMCSCMVTFSEYDKRN